MYHENPLFIPDIFPCLSCLYHRLSEAAGPGLSKSPATGAGHPSNLPATSDGMHTVAHAIRLAEGLSTSLSHQGHHCPEKTCPD